MTSRAELLFECEAMLREAAVDHAKWINSSNRTAAILNETRKALRDAAIAYAEIVSVVDAEVP